MKIQMPILQPQYIAKNTPMNEIIANGSVTQITHVASVKFRQMAMSCSVATIASNVRACIPDYGILRSLTGTGILNIRPNINLLLPPSALQGQELKPRELLVFGNTSVKLANYQNRSASFRGKKNKAKKKRKMGMACV